MPTSKEKKQNGNLLTIISPSTDRLRLLPIEIRSNIYKFVLETLTVHVTRKLGDDVPIAYKRLLSPPGRKHIASWQKLCTNNPVWSASTHLSLRTALQWLVDNRISLRGSVNEIIYELTGFIRSKQAIALQINKIHDKQKPRQHWRSLAKKDSVLIDRLRKTKGQVEKIHKDFNCAPQAFQGVDLHFSALVQAFQSVLDVVSQLSTAQLLSNPNPTLNSDVNILREISRMVADDSSDFDIELAAPLPVNYFSLTSVSRFYRLEALPILASSIVYDFGSKTDTLHDFRNCLSPDSQRHLKNVKITMVEGFMGFMLPCNSTTPLTPVCTTLSTYINSTLPALRVLNIDLWPRTPTRTDTENRAWGQQSEDLLRSLTTDAKAKVRLEMRWAADCERFEREYVRGGAWVRVWREASEEMESGNGEMCHRFYETRGGG